MNTPMFKTGDKILVFGIAVMLILLMALNTIGVSPGGRLTAVITQNGSFIKRINLNDVTSPEFVYINEPVKQVIRAEKGRIRFLRSDCPNQICVKTGWLTEVGDRAVCMPSRVVITIVGGNRHADSISY